MSSQPVVSDSSATSPQEERRWSLLGNQMSFFHESFKKDFNTLYDLADERQGLSLQRYLQLAKTFDQHVTMHHTLEEGILFPLLAQYMPQFGKGEESGNHFESHHAIHDGLDKLRKLTDNWLELPSTYSSSEMKDCLDGLREVLFRHLDEEVEDLRPANLKKYFTLDEYEQLLAKRHNHPVINSGSISKTSDQTEK